MIPTHFLWHSGWVDLCDHLKCRPPGGAILSRFLVNSVFYFCGLFILSAVCRQTVCLCRTYARRVYVNRSLLVTLLFGIHFFLPPGKLRFSEGIVFNSVCMFMSITPHFFTRNIQDTSTKLSGIICGPPEQIKFEYHDSNSLLWLEK